MLPLVAIATSVIPDLIKILAGDKAGAVADNVANAVSIVTGTEDPEIAKKRLNEDPAAAAALRVKLAQIALEETKIQNAEQENVRKNQLAQFQAQLQADEQKRRDDLARLQAQFQNESQKRKEEFENFQAQLKSDLENTAGARNFQENLARAGSPLAWAPAIVSVVVSVFFVAVVILLLVWTGPTQNKELLNICVGALVAGFSTVISYWLGSSQGSRDKDLASRQMQAAQTTLATRQIEASAQRTTEFIEATTRVVQPRPAEPAKPAPATKTDNFEQCFQLVLGAEGGFSDHREDPGGPTKFGITIGTLTDWRKGKDPNVTVTREDVIALQLDEAKEIYRTNYWNRMRCGDLPKGVDLLVFDHGVNAGPGTSVRILQKILGVDQDGSIGPLTMHALGAFDQEQLIQEFSARRLEFYRGLAKFPTFGLGWTNRANSMEQAATRMAA